MTHVGILYRNSPFSEMKHLNLQIGSLSIAMLLYETVPKPPNLKASKALHSHPASYHPRHDDKGIQLRSYQIPIAVFLEKNVHSNLRGTGMGGVA